MKEANVQQPWFNYICARVKTVEGRLNRGSWKNLVEGETVIFSNEDDKIESTIKRILLFEDFGKAYDYYGDKLIPNSTREDVISIYNQFYSNQDIQTYGVICIELLLTI